MADIFWDGFDHYGIAGETAVSSGSFLSGGSLITGYWTNLAANGVAGQTSVSIVAGRFANSRALQFSISGGSTGAFNNINKTLSASYGTIIFGFAANVALGVLCGIVFQDSGTAQVSVGINGSGQIFVCRGNLNGTVLATSAQSVTTNTWHHIGGQIKFDPSAGTVAIYLDGVLTSINLTSQNTRASGNSSANIVAFQQINAGTNLTIDDVFLFDTTGGTNNTFPGDVRVETLFPTNDVQAQFAFGSAVLGAAYNGVNGSDAPGANELVLRPFKTGPAGTLNDVRILPAATSAGVNRKAVLYADNGLGTAPTGAPIATGTQVTGCTSGVVLALPFSVGQSLSANTTYWIGCITDTSVALSLSDGNNLGYKVANTYASGPPTNPTMTGTQPSWMIWGNLTATGVNWWEVGQNPSVLTLSGVASSTVGNEDLLGTGGLSSNPNTIYGLKVMALMARSDAGPRTISLRTKSGASDSGGSLTGQTPSSSYTFLESYFDTDPATGVAWLAAGVNNAAYGYKIDS